MPSVGTFQHRARLQLAGVGLSICNGCVGGRCLGSPAGGVGGDTLGGSSAIVVKTGSAGVASMFRYLLESSRFCVITEAFPRDFLIVFSFAETYLKSTSLNV